MLGRYMKDGVRTNFFGLKFAQAAMTIFKYDVKFQREANDREAERGLGRKSPVDVGQKHDDGRPLNPFIPLNP